MGEQGFDYYYGDESGQFSFYRIPRQLITGARFKRLSTDAKLLYGLLLDRMGLSAKNGWYDEKGRVYIYYPLEEIQQDMNCGHDKATKLLVELDSGKGFGLIERIRQGQGRPTKIYVKRFTTREIPPRPALPQAPPSSQECGKVAAQTAEKPQSGLRNIRRQECGKPAASYIESNQTDFIYTDPSIYPAQPPPNMEWIDRNDCRREVEERIEAQALRRQFGYDDVESVVELMTDTLCSTRPTLRIGGEEIPAEQVKGRFLSLDYAMKLEAMRHKAGRRSKEETAALEASGKKPMRADEELAQQTGESRSNIQKLVRLNNLTPELQQMVEDKTLPVHTAADLSYLKKEEQAAVADAIQKEDKVPTGAQAVELKKASQEGKLTKEKIEQAVAPTKREETPPLKITLMEEDLRPYFPDKRTTIPDVKRGVLEALDLRKKALERQKAKAQADKDGKKKPEPSR